ncbi:uncharacterized protein LOC132041825 [Lycium ferocissimum]|uniref:uncharacterized protein LOC132041825 n=1 Tax=Lycium ferocissimum TaxID=112874 RepID=UPI00281629B1|nr:uncharacterized protein LOC132041825 [Lycium ferocissimum]
MEGNACEIDHLDSDVVLPPRKRLLAGLTNQNFDVNPCTPSPPIEFDIRLNNLLKFRSDDCNRSIEEIVEASRVEALKAVELAKAARDVAEEKAEKAAKAMAAAKSAMELVAAISDEVTGRDKYSTKNKITKHVPVQMLYNKYKGTKDCRKDEDLAPTLRRSITSSPRISKNSTSDGRNHKHKRLKNASPSEKAKFQDGSTSTTKNRNYSGHGKPMNLKEKFGESLGDICNIGKKKGRMKQKKLPLSICSFRDKVNPKMDMNSKSSSLPVERSSTWKCQAFKAPTCVKQ